MLAPPISPDDHRIKMGINNVKGVLSRKNRWDDMTELSTWMTKRYPWKIWDHNVLTIYLVYLRTCTTDFGRAGSVALTDHEYTDTRVHDAH